MPGKIPPLDDSRKEKLVEVLLVMGSILAAFTLPQSLIWMFMIFILMSILYLIFFKEPNMKGSNLFLVISAFVSFTFIGIVVYNFGVSLINSYPQFAYIYLILTILYYVIFGAILTAALYKN